MFMWMKLHLFLLFCSLCCVFICYCCCLLMHMLSCCFVASLLFFFGKIIHVWHYSDIDCGTISSFMAIDCDFDVAFAFRLGVREPHNAKIINWFVPPFRHRKLIVHFNYLILFSRRLVGSGANCVRCKSTLIMCF